jgi:phage terminase large subunit-like protein
MSQRKSVSELQGRVSSTAAQIRAKQEARVFELGCPQTPAYLWNNRPVYDVWKKYSAFLLSKRLLAYSDGAQLLELCEAQAAGQIERKNKALDFWRDRNQFPAPLQAENKLDDFLADVADERATFKQRLVPGQTIVLDGEAPYEWSESDPATVARRYAQDVLEGAVVAGELVKLAAKRFLSDLETGASRGLFFDPIAARHIVEFAETFCSLKLMAWQVFSLVNIFSFKKPSGARRFTEAWVSTAKKSGKTALAAIVALWGLVADVEPFPDVFAAATKKDQAKLCWRDAKRVVINNTELRNHVQRWSGSLTVSRTDGSFTPLSADEKGADGLRPSTIIMDEVSFWGDRSYFDTLSKGVVSREQPLVFAITTSGPSKLCFAFDKFALGEKILRGIFADDTTFVAIYKIDADDDPMDEKCWPKANPSLGVTLRVEHLKKIRDEVLQQPSGLNSWLQYHVNVWPEVTLSRTGSIPAKKWDACTGFDLIGESDPKKAITKFLNLNKDTACFGGLDVGLTSDMSAFSLLWPKARFTEGGPLIDKKVIVTQFFMPEDGLLSKEKSWNVPLSAWARESWIDLLPGDMADPKLIRRYIIDTKTIFRIREIGFDDWNARVLCAEINESGAVECIAVPQTAKELTSPARELLQAVNDRSLVHFGSPCLTWHASNVILAEDEKHGGIKPDKMSYNEKIDGIAATLNAWHRMLSAPPECTGKMYFFGDGGTATESDGKGHLIPMKPLTTN